MKFILLFLSLAVSAVAGSTDVDHRRTTVLEDTWKVEFATPIVAYDRPTNVFTVTTNLGNDNTFTYYSFELFDVCPNGDDSWNDAEVLEDDAALAIKFWVHHPVWIIFHDDDLTFSALTATELQSKWSFTVDSSIVDAPIFTDADGFGIATFCIRVGSWDFQHSYSPTLINFQQVKLTVEYSLYSDFSNFEMERFSTQVVNPDEQTVSEGFATTAKLCDLENDLTRGTAANPFNQGQQICIEVCPSATDTALASVQNIVNLDLFLEDPPTSASMVVLKDGSSWGNTVLDQICTVDACCRVRFLLQGDFFPVGEENVPKVAEVRGDGKCTLALNNQPRRLGKNRALQVTANSEFDTTFEIDRQPLEFPSGGESFSTRTKLAVAAGVAGAVLLL